MMKKKQGGTEVLEVLGEGLTSRVYKAIRKHSALDVQQVVALKVLHSQELIHSLKNEIELLLTVDSPYCVKLLGWEETAKGLGLVLEYLDGVSLEDLCCYRSLDTLEIEDLIYQIQEGLKELHAKGIIHGDISPKNIFVTVTGQIKIIDFGFSSRGQKPCEYGTPNCMSLEAWRGDALTTASDLFSLGLLRETLFKSESPSNFKDWRGRAEVLKNKNVLLMEDPEARGFLKLEPRGMQRLNISNYVQDMQRWRSQQQPTIKLESRPTKLKPQQKWMRHSVCWCLAVFASASISAAAHVPSQSEKSNYNLDIRSRLWARTVLYKKMHGREQLYHEGYTPAALTALPEGEYVLHWTSQKKSGIIEIQMRQDRKLIIDAQ